MNIKRPLRTQEEDLFRRSDLPELMDRPQVRKHYPLSGTQGFYCEATVDKDKMLDPVTPFVVGVVTMPAVVNPHPGDYLVTRKARRILAIAAENKHETIILGAWGCGVFMNDPRTIAKTFRDLLWTPEFAHVFQDVIFAVPGKESENYQLFESVIRSI